MDASSGQSMLQKQSGTIGATSDYSEKQVFGSGVLVAEALPFLGCQQNHPSC
jgi:hypothetical protein